ncbi:unnamed protein product [Clonostachys rosea]|uniref:Uncharacterized protein n=1 Tax=Bionectria ochroleuca TaxID=29856 RepID=A0ABY6ULT7_BIOOC|nr:unnamed protein product [Clonostachys rosea]
MEELQIICQNTNLESDSGMVGRQAKACKLLQWVGFDYTQPRAFKPIYGTNQEHTNVVDMIMREKELGIFLQGDLLENGKILSNLLLISGAGLWLPDIKKTLNLLSVRISKVTQGTPNTLPIYFSHAGHTTPKAMMVSLVGQLVAQLLCKIGPDPIKKELNKARKKVDRQADLCVLCELFPHLVSLAREISNPHMVVCLVNGLEFSGGMGENFAGFLTIVEQLVHMAENTCRRGDLKLVLTCCRELGEIENRFDKVVRAGITTN